MIIEAVGSLIASPRQTYSYWLVSPLECIIFIAAVLITFFTTIEIGIYVSLPLCFIQRVRTLQLFYIQSDSTPSNSSLSLPLLLSSLYDSPSLAVLSSGVSVCDKKTSLDRQQLATFTFLYAQCRRRIPQSSSSPLQKASSSSVWRKLSVSRRFSIAVAKFSRQLTSPR